MAPAEMTEFFIGSDKENIAKSKVIFDNGNHNKSSLDGRLLPPQVGEIITSDESTKIFFNEFVKVEFVSVNLNGEPVGPAEAIAYFNAGQSVELPRGTALCLRLCSSDREEEEHFTTTIWHVTPREP